nr:hypothetical protein [Tanacetum cinerariifolium]
HEHYALWEVIKFGDSYVVPTSAETTDTASDGTSKKKGRTFTMTADDMQKRKNDVKARTTLLLSLPDEHQLRFKGTETLEQTFNRLQVIVNQLQFMDVEIEKDDLNQKFLTSLASEWLMHTIDMVFISSSKNSNNEDGNTICVTTATTAFPTSSVNVATISQDTASAFIASQSNGSQIKFEDINQIDEDDMEEIDIKWNMTLPLPTVVSTSAEDQNKDTSTSEDAASQNPPKPFVKFIKSKSQNHSYKSSTHRSAGHRPNGAHMRPPLRSFGPRPHGDSIRPSFRPASHRPHGPSMNPRRPTMNGARPYKSFFQTPSYETRPFLKSSAVNNPYRAPWVPTVNRPAGHRPHSPSINPRRPTMNGARPHKTFFQTPSFETRPFLKSSAVNNSYRAPWVSTANRYVPPVNRKFSTGRRNFPTAHRKFPTASRKFTTSSTKNHTADMGGKGKAVKPSACWTWNP